MDAIRQLGNDAAQRYSEICHSLFGSKPVTNIKELGDIGREFRGFTPADVERAVRELGTDPTRLSRHKPTVFEVLKVARGRYEGRHEIHEANPTVTMRCMECGYEYAVESGASLYCQWEDCKSKLITHEAWEAMSCPRSRRHEQQRRGGPVSQV